MRFVLQADLALFYILLPDGLGEIGEQWDRSSYLQALGFLILVAGTLVYGRGDEELDKQEVAKYTLPISNLLQSMLAHTALP